jgi:hypothetical protein
MFGHPVPELRARCEAEPFWFTPVLFVAAAAESCITEPEVRYFLIVRKLDALSFGIEPDAIRR